MIYLYIQWIHEYVTSSNYTKYLCPHVSHMLTYECADIAVYIVGMWVLFKFYIFITWVVVFELNYGN